MLSLSSRSGSLPTRSRSGLEVDATIWKSWVDGVVLAVGVEKVGAGTKAGEADGGARDTAVLARPCGFLRATGVVVHLRKRQKVNEQLVVRGECWRDLQYLGLDATRAARRARVAEHALSLQRWSVSLRARSGSALERRRTLQRSQAGGFLGLDRGRAG